MLNCVNRIRAAVIRVYRCGMCQHVFLSQFIEIRCPKCKSAAVDEVRQ